MSEKPHSVNDVAQWILRQPSEGMRWLELNFQGGTWNAILFTSDAQYNVEQEAIGEGDSPQKAILSALSRVKGEK